MKKVLLVLLTVLTTNAFADDIWFISPHNGAPANGQMKVQIQPPYQNVPVRVWIETEGGFEQMVWQGELNTANNYTLTVDTSKFRPGLYQLEAKYFMYGEDYDGDVEFWVGGAPSGQQYFPQ